MPSVYNANNAAAYEQLMGRWSRRLAPLFIDFAAIGDVSSVLDVGCGTGCLTFVLAEAFPSARIRGLDYSQAFIVDASSKAPADGRLVFEQGDATSLPYEDRSFDAALSMLVLNFVSDAQKAARELVRVTRDGGTVAACVWDFRGGLTHLRVFADTAAALDPSGEAFRARVFSGPFTRSGEFASTWTEMGLREVEQTSLTIRMEFNSFTEYWEPMLAGQGTAGAYVQSLDSAKRSLIEHYLRCAYCAGDADGPRSFTATAWACRGIRS